MISTVVLHWNKVSWSGIFVLITFVNWIRILFSRVPAVKKKETAFEAFVIVISTLIFGFGVAVLR